MFGVCTMVQRLFGNRRVQGTDNYLTLKNRPQGGLEKYKEK